MRNLIFLVADLLLSLELACENRSPAPVIDELLVLSSQLLLMIGQFGELLQVGDYLLKVYVADLVHSGRELFCIQFGLPS